MHGSLKNIRLFVILLLILSVAASSLFSPENSEESKSNTELASGKDAKNNAEEISKPVELEAVVPFFAFDVIKYTYLIFQQNFQNDIKEEVYIGEPQYTSNYFKTLFRFVISPNAP